VGGCGAAGQHEVGLERKRVSVAVGRGTGVGVGVRVGGSVVGVVGVEVLVGVGVVAGAPLRVAGVITIYTKNKSPTATSSLTETRAKCEAI
jgi:hypothetical protein